MFNGEIYNHDYLRDKLKKTGQHFKTKLDTEVILNGLEHFGVDFVKELRGQFSIVYFNKKLKKLYFIRDRVGQKPLFYSWDNNLVLVQLTTAEISNNISINEKSVNEYLEWSSTIS